MFNCFLSLNTQAYSTAQPVQFMFPGIPSLVPNGTFPSTATIATSVPGAIKMEFPQNGYVSVSISWVSKETIWEVDVDRETLHYLSIDQTLSCLLVTLLAIRY